MWRPARCLQKHRASHAEDDLAYIASDGEGVRLFTALGGFSGSSTRTEIAAGIIATSCHGPVHIGSDSQVFVDQANVILDQIRDGCIAKRCWKTTSDGDLWEHFAKVATAKTPNSIRLTWVKGHANDWHVVQDMTTEVN